MQRRLRLLAAMLACTCLFGSLARASPPATHPGPVRGEPGDESAFLTENAAAMEQMMAAMAVAPSGDVDRDFVAMMVPHHQGAIDMALAVLRHGRNERIKRLAQEIIVTQQQEIAAMRLAVGAPLPDPTPAPPQPAKRAHPHTHHSLAEQP